MERRRQKSKFSPVAANFNLLCYILKSTKRVNMKKLDLVFLFFAACLFKIQAQDSELYFEFADHQSLTSSFYDMIPRGSQSAYLIQNANIAKIEGRNKSRIYSANWSRSEFNIFTNEEDSTIFMYNYSDYDIGIGAVTKIKLNGDSIEVINHVDDYFNNGCLYPMLDLFVSDIIMDSLGQSLAFNGNGVLNIIERYDSLCMQTFLDTVRVSNNPLPYFSKLIKNNTHDIFMIGHQNVFRVMEDYTIGPALPVEGDFLGIKFFGNLFYVLYEDHIALYDSKFQSTYLRIQLDPTYGKPNDFIIMDNNEAITLQGDDQSTSYTLKYTPHNSSPEILYQEALDQMLYSKIKTKDNHIYTLGKHREVPVLGIQPAEYTENNVRANLSIEDISINYVLEVQDNCNYWCENYFYDISYTIKNISDKIVSNFTIAAYQFPLDLSVRQPTLYARFNKDTLLMPEQALSFTDEYRAQVLWTVFPFEITGNNFTLESNFGDSVFEFSDPVLNTSEIQPTLQFKAYPNPASSIIYLESIEPIHKIGLYHINGRLIKSLLSKKELTQIETQNLSSGLYTLRIWNKDFIHFGTQKIMVQN